MHLYQHMASGAASPAAAAPETALLKYMVL
jgi:hypothetical protein